MTGGNEREIRQRIQTILAGMLFAFLCIAVSAQPSNQAFAEEVQPSEEAERTVMLYLCGSNLEPPMATHNLEQILQSKFSSNGKVRFVVMTGGSKRWKLGSEHLLDPEHPDQEIYSISKKYNQIWEAKGADAPVEAEKGKLILLDRDGISGDGAEAKVSDDELMSDPDTLKAFINYCMDYAPAKKYDLILWDHGDGPVRGFAIDKHDPDERMMSFSQIIDALSDNDVIKSSSQKRFDMVNFDACLMNSVELNLALADLTDFYIASAEPEPGFGQDGTLAVIDTKKLLESGFAEALNEMNAVLKQQATEKTPLPDGTGGDYLYYDELASVEGSIQYSPGRETYRDMGNLAGQLCIPLREFASRSAGDNKMNDYEDASRSICGILGNENIIYARSTEGIKGGYQLILDGRGDLKYEELHSSGMYLFFPNMLGTAETAEYYQAVKKVWELMDSRGIGNDACRAFLKNYPKTALEYALLAEAGKAVSALVEQGTAKADIDYRCVKNYWETLMIPVLTPIGEPTGEEISLWDKSIRQIIGNYEGGEDAARAWLDPLILQQAGDAVSIANITAIKTSGADHDGYKITINETDKRIVDSVDTQIVAEFPDVVGVDPEKTKFVIHTIPGALDISDLIPDGSMPAESLMEALQKWFAKRQCSWNVEKGAVRCYALADAEGKKHAVQVKFEKNGTAKAYFSYTVMEPVDPPVPYDGTDEGQENDELQPVSKIGILIFERNGGDGYKLSQYIPEHNVPARPIAVKDLETELTDARAVYDLTADGMAALVRINKDPFMISGENADSIRLVLTDIDQIPDIGDADGNDKAYHGEYIVKDMYHHKFNITDIVQAAKDEPQPEKISIQDAEVILSATTYTYNGKVHKPAIKTINGKALEEGTDYMAKWSNASSKKAGTYTVTITGKGNYTGTAKATYKIRKAANLLKIGPKAAVVKYCKLKKKARSLAATRVIRFTRKLNDKKTYKLSSVKKGSKSFKKYFKINKKTGKVKIRKGLKKGTYKVKVKVKAAGNANYKPSAWKTVTFKVKVK